jgi:pilus assembly protein FimV
MLRKKAVALALSMLMPTVASALGLGALKAQSGLNQPFDGRIEILGATANDFDTLSIKLASPEAFERAGVMRDAVLLALKFEVVETPAGNDYIRVSTRDPVREPFLNFLLELNWANGRMVREYTVLLDPPLYDPNRRAAAPAYTPAPAAMRPPATAPEIGRAHV